MTTPETNPFSPVFADRGQEASPYYFSHYLGIGSWQEGTYTTETFNPGSNWGSGILTARISSEQSTLFCIVYDQERPILIASAQDSDFKESRAISYDKDGRVTIVVEKTPGKIVTDTMLYINNQTFLVHAAKENNQVSVDALIFPRTLRVLPVIGMQRIGKIAASVFFPEAFDSDFEKAQYQVGTLNEHNRAVLAFDKFPLGIQIDPKTLIAKRILVATATAK